MSMTIEWGSYELMLNLGFLYFLENPNYVDSYVDRYIYIRILGWITIYVFSSTNENDTILWKQE